MATPTTVTRDELYRRVWSTPILQLAKEFGISDVALAKICQKLDVPRPPRGYWQQLEHGQKPPKARLPRARAGTRQKYVIEQHAPRPRPPDEKREPPPEVPIAENLRAAHPAARALNAVLDREKPTVDGMFYIRARHESCVRISPLLRRRALLVLDALAHALEARGHSVTFEGAPPEDFRAPSRIHAKVFDESISLHLFEPLIQSKLVLTSAQEAEKKKRGWLYDREYVLKPSGKLVVRAEGDYSASAKWSDGNGRLVEDQLGKAVLGIERLVGRVREKAAESARRREAWKRDERRRDARIASENYNQALFCDLESMAESWGNAQHILRFLEDLRARVPEDKRAPGFREWLEWAEREAAALDPIGEPARVPKKLAPDFLGMADDELAGWAKRGADGGPEPLPTHGASPSESACEEEDAAGDEDAEGDSNLL